MSNDSEPSGLGGWLVLPMIGLFITPIQAAIAAKTTYLPIFTTGTWEALTTPGTEAYHHLWAPILIFEIACNALFFVAAIVLLYLMFRKHYLLPKLMVAFYIAQVVYVGLDYYLGEMIPTIAEMDDPEEFKQLTRSVMGACIWIPYFLSSKRVKNTFVHGKQAEPESETSDVEDMFPRQDFDRS